MPYYSANPTAGSRVYKCMENDRVEFTLDDWKAKNFWWQLIENFHGILSQVLGYILEHVGKPYWERCRRKIQAFSMSKAHKCFS